MANEEHLALIRQGVDVWNAWREVNSRVQPNLSGTRLDWVDLSGANLRGVDLSRSSLILAKLDGTNLKGANLSYANLKGANLNHANLKGANLSQANLSETKLSYANLSEAKLRASNLRGSILIGAELSLANLSEAKLWQANLCQTILIGADLSLANLSLANLIRAKLRGANFWQADLRGANLSQSDLRETRLIGANLSQSDLKGANLIGADLSQSIVNATLFVDIDLSTARHLETVKHDGPSPISISTLVLSQGKIPEVFLRGCGVPESLIEYLPSLLGAMEPIQFYSCFISYSTKDQDFAQRLYESMQGHRLRVWFAPEEMKAGQKIHEQIDQAIRVHDKLVLVLSEQSIQSEWVMTEIRKARKAELRDKRRKLFPIGLIDFDTLRDWECFDADSGKDLAVEIREYFIPDFTKWKDHDAFEANFAKLLRDLKAAT